MAGKKQGYLEWLFGNKEATYPINEYSFFLGAVNFADTNSGSIINVDKNSEVIFSVDIAYTPPVKKNVNGTHANVEGILALDNDAEEEPLSEEEKKLFGEEEEEKTLSAAEQEEHAKALAEITKRQEESKQYFLTDARYGIILLLKSIDFMIQCISGTFIFGVIQNAGEGLRDKYKEDDSIFGNAMGLIGVGIATLGRIGLFFTQILAGALRVPFMAVGFLMGLTRGLWLAAFKTEEIKTPAHIIILRSIADCIWPFAPRTAALLSISTMPKEQAPLTPDIKRHFGIGALSVVAAVALVTTFALGPFGLGAVGGVLGIGAVGLGAKIVIGAMLTGALTTFLSNSLQTIFSIKDAGSALLKKYRYNKSEMPDPEDYAPQHTPPTPPNGPANSRRNSVASGDGAVVGHVTKPATYHYPSSSGGSSPNSTPASSAKLSGQNSNNSNRN